MTTIFKYFMFGKYGCLDTNARGCCMHVFLVNTQEYARVLCKQYINKLVLCFNPESFLRASLPFPAFISSQEFLVVL